MSGEKGHTLDGQIVLNRSLLFGRVSCILRQNVSRKNLASCSFSEGHG